MILKEDFNLGPLEHVITAFVHFKNGGQDGQQGAGAGQTCKKTKISLNRQFED